MDQATVKFAGDNAATSVRVGQPKISLARRAGFDDSELLGGRYRLLHELGSGGMGRVFKAENVAIGKEVAIKLLRAKRLEAEVDERRRYEARFLREARATTQLRHPNIVDVIDFGHSADGVPFLVMEFLEGEDLAKTLERERRLPWPRARHLLLQILDALARAHELGVVHRDLKPANCFRITRLNDHDFVKIVDFGIAKTSSTPDSESLTSTGMIMGTPAYMAPEQLMNTEVGPYTDLYSAGIILFELVTGRRPFHGKPPIAIASDHLQTSPPSPRSINPDISPSLEAVVLKALAKEPAERFQSAREFADALSEPAMEQGADLAGDGRVLRRIGVGVLLVFAVFAVVGYALKQRATAVDAEIHAELIDRAPPTPAPERVQELSAVGTTEVEPAEESIEPRPESPDLPAVVSGGELALEEVVAPKPTLKKHPRKLVESKLRRTRGKLRNCTGMQEGISLSFEVAAQPSGRVSVELGRSYQGTDTGRCIEKTIERMVDLGSADSKSRHSITIKL